MDLIIASPIFSLLLVLIFLKLVLSPSVASNTLRPGSSVHEYTSQEYRSGLPFPSPGDLPEPDLPDSANPPTSPVLAGGFFTTEPLGFS